MKRAFPLSLAAAALLAALAGCGQTSPRFSRRRFLRRTGVLLGPGRRRHCGGGL